MIGRGDHESFAKGVDVVNRFHENLRKGKLSGRELEDEAHGAFAHFARGMNTIDQWSG